MDTPWEEWKKRTRRLWSSYGTLLEAHFAAYRSLVSDLVGNGEMTLDESKKRINRLRLTMCLGRMRRPGGERYVHEMPHKDPQ